MVDVGSASAKLYVQSAIYAGIVVTSAWYSENCRQPMLQSRLTATSLHIWLFHPIGAHQCSAPMNPSILQCHVSSVTGSVLYLCLTKPMTGETLHWKWSTAMSDGIRISVLNSWPQDSPPLRLVISRWLACETNQCQTLVNALAPKRIITQVYSPVVHGSQVHTCTHTHTHTHIRTHILVLVLTTARTSYLAPIQGGEPAGSNKTGGPVGSGDTSLISTSACPRSVHWGTHL